MTLLQMSLQGAALIGVTLVIRALGKNRLPKKTFMALWGVALVRLLIPFFIPSPFSAYQVVENIGAMSSTVAPMLPQAQVQAQVQAAVAAPVAAPLRIPPQLLLQLVWAAVALLCAAFFLARHLRCQRIYREALPAGHPGVSRWMQAHKLLRPVQVRVSDRIRAPLTYGALRPVILLPMTLDLSDEQALAYILMHEVTHIRRFDVLWKWAMVAAVCAHWFNPLAWVLLLLADRDMELRCDEAVVKAFGPNTRSQYARMLLTMEERRGPMTPLCNNFSKQAIEERIVSIMKMRKLSLASMVIAVAVVLVAVAAFATSAAPVVPQEAQAKQEAQDTQAAAEYHLSLPRIEATHHDELIAGDGQSITASLSYANGKIWGAKPSDEFVPLTRSVADFDTLEEAEKELSFPLARPAYLPEGSAFLSARLSWFQEENADYEIGCFYRTPSDIGISVQQNDVGPEAVLMLQTVHRIEEVEYEGRTYLCDSRYYEKDGHFIETLYWLEGDFAFQVMVGGYPVGGDGETHPYLETALRIAASMSLPEE
jgi:beta-lactamase regulating signal transducer with metallopeptidase domain